MFESSVYKNRRSALLAGMAESGARGLAIFLGNTEAPMNYRGNDYKFRQDSSFIYFWGIDCPGFAAILDLESGCECIYADDVDIDDIVWMGPQPSVASRSALAGVEKSKPFAAFAEDVKAAMAKGRAIHHLPTSRYYNNMTVAALTGASYEACTRPSSMTDGGRHASLELVREVVKLRLIKEQCEIEELDKAGEIGYLMHTAARRNCRLGVVEQEIVGAMEGVTLAHGWGVSFTTILSQHGETLHNHHHDGTVTDGRLLLVDAGAESNTHYASDYTRTYPTGGRFTPKQREIYDIVYAGNELAAGLAAPGMTYRDVHLAVARVMLEGLREAGLVRGNIDDMIAEGTLGMFMPHGLGHNMGLDVHDMEDYGEIHVGYDDDQVRSPQLGLGNLRMARRLRPGHVVTDEPGIYFIPALIRDWKTAGKSLEFINYDRLEKEYSDFGGIRIEDDLLITENGCRRLGFRRLPASAAEVEEAMAKDREE
ncbi:MAG: aminopeptidase P family protein [Bacteroidales bacterium]|nr:aminopeptidase P family protein [Bacteroidales bacterium]